MSRQLDRDYDDTLPRGNFEISVISPQLVSLTSQLCSAGNTGPTLLFRRQYRSEQESSFRPNPVTNTFNWRKKNMTIWAHQTSLVFGARPRVIGQHSLPRQRVCFPLAPPESTLTSSPKKERKRQNNQHSPPKKHTGLNTLQISHPKGWPIGNNIKQVHSFILFPKRGIIQKHQSHAPIATSMYHESHLVSADHPVTPSSLPNADAEKTQDKEKKSNPEISTPIPPVHQPPLQLSPFIPSSQP